MRGLDDILARMSQRSAGPIGAVFEVVPAGAALPRRPAIGVRVSEGGLACHVGRADRVLADLYLVGGPGAPSLHAVSAILCSPWVGGVFLAADLGLADFPLARITQPFLSQLDLLWPRWVDASGPQAAALGGTFDRVAAELYGLDLDALMALAPAELHP